MKTPAQLFMTLVNSPREESTGLLAKPFLCAMPRLLSSIHSDFLRFFLLCLLQVTYVS